MSGERYFWQTVSLIQAAVGVWVGEDGCEVVWVCHLALHEAWSCAPGLAEAVRPGSLGLGGDGVCQSGSAAGEYCCVTPQTSCSV